MTPLHAEQARPLRRVDFRGNAERVVVHVLVRHVKRRVLVKRRLRDRGIKLAQEPEHRPLFGLDLGVEPPRARGLFPDELG
jgi:hypothetical protein